MNHLPSQQTSHFRLFPPTTAAKSPGIHSDSTILKTNGKNAFKTGDGGTRSTTSLGSNHFVTTPLPIHGPNAGYGYTTTNSFVNVQFGGSVHVTSTPYPPFSKSVTSSPTFSKTVTSHPPFSKAPFTTFSKTVSPHSPFSKSLAPQSPFSKAINPYKTVSKPVSVKPKGIYQEVSEDKPFKFSDDTVMHKKWSQISQYHLENQKPISRPNHTLMTPDSHIKQTAISPTFLPPLTPIIKRPLLEPLTEKKHSKSFSFPAPPRLHFYDDHHEKQLQQLQHPVTLPPFIDNIVDQPIFVRYLNHIQVVLK